MQLKKLFKIMRLLKAPSLIIAAALLLSRCAVIKVHDSEWCSPIPGTSLVDCDNFLTSAPVQMNSAGWAALQQQWLNAGFSVECTNSGTLIDLRDDIEEVCSKYTCDYMTQMIITNGLTKIQTLGKSKLK